MASPVTNYRKLTKEDIIETVGTAVALEDLEELEILFLSFREISALEHTPRLRKLTLIDNGISLISNLSRVSISLTSLCLCDQDIASLEGISACPNLREVCLHRNAITSMGAIAGCSRLRKLWLFQNKIAKIEGLHGLPELVECWLQSNQIKGLTGFEHCPSLANLGNYPYPSPSCLNTPYLTHIQLLQVTPSRASWSC